MNNLINEDSQMRSLMKILGSEDPGDIFSANIMDYISKNLAPAVRPFRLNKGSVFLYILIFLTSQLLTVVAVLNNGTGAAAIPSVNYNAILNNILAVINSFVPAEIMIIVVCIFWILFVLDILLKRSKFLKHNQ